MPMSLPSASADGTPRRTLTLADLRALVAAADGLDDALIVRCQAIPFHMPDLGHSLGGRALRLALDRADTADDEPPAASNRRPR